MAGIFDVFTILFKSETSEATEGIKDLDQAVDQLDQSVAAAETQVNDLGEGVQAAGDVAGKSFMDMASSAAALAAGIVSVSAVVSQFNAAVGMADQLDEFSGSVDENIELISAWGDAVKMNGGDMQSFQNTFASLSADFTAFAVKGKSKIKPFFDELGISMLDANGKARGVMDVLPELADAFGKLSKQESLAFGRKMGLDAGTVRTLQNGGEELEKLINRQRELGVITAEQAGASAEFNDALDDTAHAFRSIYLALAVEILPVFSSILHAVQEVTIFFREHSGFAIGFFGTIAAVIAAVYLPAIFSAIAATAGLLLPFLPIIAIVGALAAAIGLLYDDFVNWTEGGQSLLGELFGDFESFKTSLIDIFETIKAHIGAVWDALTNPIDTLKALKTSLIDALSPIKDMMPSWDDIKAGAQVAFENVNTPLAGMTSAAMGAGNIANSSTVTVGKVEVNTQATDAEGISRDIGAQLNKQLSQTAATYDDGVAY